jgi:predicted RNA binding protein YcfA (HicA-like mRNA interferase family)
MSKLPSISSSTLIKFFEKQGFKIDHQSGSHVVMYDEKTTKRAVIPHPRKDLPRGTVISIIKEAGFTRQDLVNFLYK